MNKKREVYTCNKCNRYFLTVDTKCHKNHFLNTHCHCTEEEVLILVQEKLKPTKCIACLEANKLEKGGFDAEFDVFVRSGREARHLRDYHCTCEVEDA